MFVKELDFVAVCNNKIVGNIVYAKVKVVGEGNSEQVALTMGPVSVLPAH